MRLFVYEFVSGGGWWSCDAQHPPGGSLLREGAGMLRALVADFARIGKVSTLCDVRWPLPDLAADVRWVASAAAEREQFAELVRQSDACLVVAPEFSGILQMRAAWIEQLGGVLLSPNSRFVAVAGDKHRTAELLASRGVPVPRGCLVSDRQNVPDLFPFPGVLKPNDGAGSLDVRRVANRAEVWAGMEPGREYQLVEFCPGLAGSVAVLSGPNQRLVLPACRQFLSDDGRFRYLGGQVPLAADLCRRAEVLALAVVDAMPVTQGYFGLDLVLGDQPDGSQDAVIEVNPRLTTSYLGLRQLSRTNLALAMWLMAHGDTVDLSFDPGPVQFAAN